MKNLMIGASALALAACGNTEDAVSPEAPATPAMAAETAPADTAALPATAQPFVDMASASDMFEVEAGKLAQANGTSDAVKEFGAMMVKDHTKSTTDLKAAAGNVDGVTVSPRLSPKQEADLAALRSAGQDFDSVYKTQQLAAHQQALALLENFAGNGDAQPLKDFASKAVPVVSGHLEHVRTLP